MLLVPSETRLIPNYPHQNETVVKVCAMPDGQVVLQFPHFSGIERQNCCQNYTNTGTDGDGYSWA